MDKSIIIAGFGGQGILSLGQMIAYGAIHSNKEVSWLPSYGPEMRGGTSNCSVVISEKPIASPVISSPDCLIAMNKPSMTKFLYSVKKGGLVLVNQSIINDEVARDDVDVIYVDTSNIAEEAGNLKTANIVMLGVLVGKTNIFTKESIENVIGEVFATKPKVIPCNITAFNMGYEIGVKNR
ncbi:MAG: 2-oxoacid:ferredoxin oxidoreductase subunit gamma [Clostridiales bacterium]|jgi:2-oxoglutarate ferredoxin oxidoreductase subunit gamma|nr:2-oxoacid:ferredoxin oxidoreductase subunit gamma [Clostridiales bacterium]